MPRKATIFIKSTIALGLLLLAIGLAGWKSSGLLRYLSCLVIALFFSTLKVRLPGLTGSLSLNFTFVLIAVADFSFAETVAIAFGSGLMQCLWKMKRPPVALQLWFGVATMVVSAAPAWWVTGLILNAAHVDATVMLLPLAALLYFSINTSLVSAAVALAEEKPFAKLWKQCSLR